MKLQFFSLLILAFFYSIFCQTQSQSIPKSKPIILRTIPHDPTAFTQGLLYYKGLLYESTGLYNQSSLRTLNPKTGAIIKNISVPDVFAEGLCIMDSLLIQLTWEQKTAIKYSITNFAIKGSFYYTGEGWGLTTDGTSFIMSNGSDSLYVRNKQFAITKTFAVTVSSSPLKNLNELEYVKGFIYANVWFNNNIYVIDYKTGKVLKIIDCSELATKNAAGSNQDVLNGIAYNATSNTFYVTGKNWHYIFEVTM